MSISSIVFFVILLLFGSALFAAAEFSAVAVKRIKVEALAEQGDVAAKLLLPHIANPEQLDRYVAAAQIGITVCSLLIGSIGQRNFTQYLTPVLANCLPQSIDPDFIHTVSSVIIVVFFTLLQVVLGELVPKSIALRFTESAARILIWPMALAFKLFAPCIDFLNGSAGGFLRLWGYKRPEGINQHTVDELLGQVQKAYDSRVITCESFQRIQRTLRLSSLTARDVMIPRTRMVAISTSMHLRDLLKLLADSPYTRFPIYDKTEDQIEGMVHLKDVCVALAGIGNHKLSKEDTYPLRKCTRRPVVFCPSSMLLVDVMNKLREKRAYMAILEDEYGGTDGLLTIEDILETVLGEIDDEFDKVVHDISSYGEGFLISGTMSLEEVNDCTLIDLRNRFVHTIGGLVMHLAGGIPHLGQEVFYGDHSLVVAKMDKRQVLQVVLTKDAKTTREGQG